MASSASFIDYLKPYAQAMETKYGIDWRVIIAQAAQETGWGEHPHGYNLWGMRFTGPAGEENGYALFNDQWEAIESYIYNIKKNHPTAWEVRDNWSQFIVEIQNPNYPNAGAWAEDPNYTNALYSIMVANLLAEPTSIDTGIPFPEQYTPTTYTSEQSIQDREGAAVAELPYYVKLQHVNDDRQPTGATTFKITPDSQVLLLREKLIRVQEDETATPENYSNLYNDIDAKKYHIKVKKTVTKVEKAGSLQLQIDGVLLEQHNNGAQSPSAPKINNQIQLKDEQLVFTRTTEKPTGTVIENIILADERIILEVIKNNKKDRIEVLPGKILLKGNDNSYIRIEDDVIQAQNKTKSQIWMKLDEIAVSNPINTHVYLRGDMVEMKNSSGSQVLISGSLAEVKNNAGSQVVLNGGSLAEMKNSNGSQVVLNGGNAQLTAPGSITVQAGGTVTIQGATVRIN